ncbi:MAG: NAD-dependent epimerase/dehydratase family protein [Gaiellaceae bacterium]
MEATATIVVAGAGGFVGGHVVADLRRRGFTRLRAVDFKPENEWFQRFDDVDNRRLDLSLREQCAEAVAGADHVFNFASDMGGMGFIEFNKARCMLSVLINTHLLGESLSTGVSRYFFASSACVYAADRQTSPDVVALRESDAYPAMPEDGYGWEKLFSERMCRHFAEDFGLGVRIARFHNVYGPHGTYAGGREKAPAAVCRKVAEAKLLGRGEIEIWGDGEQTRSFTYIDDAVFGTDRLMESEVNEPLNIGSSQLVTINRLVDIVEEIAGVELRRRYDLTAPQGVRGRNSDNTLISAKLGWAPSVPLEVGLEQTYRWIHDSLAADIGRTAQSAELLAAD